MGGTGAHDVAQLHDALAETLRGLPAEPGPTAVRGVQERAGAAGSPRTLLVPIGPREDSAADTRSASSRGLARTR